MRSVSIIGLVLLASGCELGPGVRCTDDAICSPWGRCGFQGYCLVIEGAPVVEDPLDAGADDAGRSQVVISETSLTFGDAGLVPCDAQAPARTFSLRNDSNQELELSFTLSRRPSTYRVNLPEMVGVGATVLVKVTPVRVPKVADTSPDFFGETLTLSARGKTIVEAHPIDLHLTAHGAKLSFKPAALTFSASAPARDTQAFLIENTGNAAATFKFATGGRFSLLWGEGRIAASEQLARTVTFTPGLAPGQTNGSIQLTSTSPLCAPLPSNLQLIGSSL